MAVKITEDTSNLVCEMESDKMFVKARVEKSPGGYGFFKILFEKGVVPQELQGNYSSIQNAKKAFISYEAGMKETQAAKNERLAELREQRKQDATKTRESS